MLTHSSEDDSIGNALYACQNRPTKESGCRGCEEREEGRRAPCDRRQEIRSVAGRDRHGAEEFKFLQREHRFVRGSRVRIRGDEALDDRYQEQSCSLAAQGRHKAELFKGNRSKTIEEIFADGAGQILDQDAKDVVWTRFAVVGGLLGQV